MLETVITAPPHVDNNQDFPLRFSYAPDGMLQGQLTPKRYRGSLEGDPLYYAMICKRHIFARRDICRQM